MNYPTVRSLLTDSEYMRGLLNDGGILKNADGRMNHIGDGWIDEAASKELSGLYDTLSAQDGTFLNAVIVVRNPDIRQGSFSVDRSEDRQRYILVTIIPDVSLTYQLNFPIIQTMGVMALESWEFSRATINACQAMARVDIVKDPIPPILNKAHVEYVTIYLGKEDYAGRADFVHCYEEDKEDGLRFDLHLYEARKMDNAVIKRLVEAYDADRKDTE